MKKLVPNDAVLIPKSAKLMFEGVIYDVYQWQQRQFDNSYKTFEMLRRADTVIAICIVNNKILVLQDEQPHSGSRRSFPGGRVDNEEDIGKAAKREVKEETGYSFKNWKLVSVWQPHTKIEWFIYLYVADGVVAKDSPELDSGEKITVEDTDFNKVKELVFDKAGYLGEARNVFDYVNNIEELSSLPPFKGREVDI